MRIVNLGILAHVDAGKTSLTERLLYTAGAIDEIGSIDDGNTRTDTLELERQRGITIKSAVTSFMLDDLTVNLVDTPGHPDFIAEVERVLSVLDGAILVVSAVEGVQPQTRILMRTLQRLSIPTLIFVNKIDRAGARGESVLEELAARLTPAVIAPGTTLDLGTRQASFVPYDANDVAFREQLVNLLTERNDAMLAAYVEDERALSCRSLLRELALQTGKALVHPVLFGSAITGAGIDALMSAIATLLPATAVHTAAPPSGSVFKVERGPAGEKIAYARMFTGTLKTRDRLELPGGQKNKVTAIEVFERGTSVQCSALNAGQIGKLSGLSDVRIGDTFGPERHREDEHYFAPPTLESVVVPGCHEERGKLRVALAQLAEQDPLINVRQDDLRQELSISLYGEVQKEVLQATLVSDYGLDVTFRETTTICVERPIGTGAAFEIIDTPPNPFLATVGLRVEPAPIGSGSTFQLAIELHGTMPAAFFKAVEETVYETLQQGLHGWQVIDCTVTMTHSGYWPRQSAMHATFDKSSSSTARDFRQLTPLVLIEALRQAGSQVYEPVHRFRLEVPADSFGVLAPALARLSAVPHTQALQRGAYILEGQVPAAQVHALRQVLPSLTGGEGVLETEFDGYRPVQGTVPERPRTDHNPLNRKEYLLRVTRHV